MWASAFLEVLSSGIAGSDLVTPCFEGPARLPKSFCSSHPVTQVGFKIAQVMEPGFELLILQSPEAGITGCA